MTTSGAGGSLQSYDHNDASSLRVPLLGGFHGGFHSLENMGGVYEAGVCEVRLFPILLQKFRVILAAHHWRM